ncbi:MAG TPA: hypothetical protein VII33_02515, partial [Nakamurella sp.]
GVTATIRWSGTVTAVSSIAHGGQQLDSPQLQSRPRNSAERVELEALLRADDRAVLEALRWETEALQLRVRIVAEAVRAARQTEIPA